MNLTIAPDVRTLMATLGAWAATAATAYAPTVHWLVPLVGLLTALGVHATTAAPSSSASSPSSGAPASSAAANAASLPTSASSSTRSTTAAADG